MNLAKTTLLRASVAAAILAGSSFAHANLLTNGSFETGVGATAATLELPVGSTALTGWTVVNDTVAWIGSPSFGLTPQDGQKWLDLTNYQAGPPFGGVEQTIATTVGQAYDLSFWLGSSSSYVLPSAITVSAGMVTVTFTSTAAGIDNWQKYMTSFTAGAGTTTIRLLGSTGHDYIGLDNVSVTAAVPEPGALALMLAGLAAVGSVAARRRQVQR